MMVAVRSTDVRDELQDGVDAAPMPPRMPDGTLAPFEPAAPLESAPPRLCEYGPCRHYHTFAVQLDAQNPMAERVGGRLVIHAKAFHVTTNHYCYPDVGIETVLGAMPVLQCNRYVPVGGLLRILTARGWRGRRRHARDLASWQAEREAESQRLAAAAGLLEPPRELIVAFYLGGVETLIGQEVDGDLSLDGAVQLAARHTHYNLANYEYRVEIDDAVIGNLEATINELEISPGTRVAVHLSHDKESA